MMPRVVESRRVCGAKGTLPGQGGHPGNIRFAHAPGALEPSEGARPIGSCTGYHPAGCGEVGYASSDIFYLEVCVYSLMCRNRHELFELQVGETWQCEMEWHGFQRLRDLAIAGLPG
jgi:hypothetical protein